MTVQHSLDDDGAVRQRAGGLFDRLARHLKSPGKYVLFNVFSTKPCVPVVHKPKPLRPLLVTRTTHYCVLFSPDNVPLVAVEIFTYCTFYKDTINKLVYVSKADTTGLAGSADVNVGAFVTEYLKWVCQMPVEDLVKGVKLKKGQKQRDAEPAQHGAENGDVPGRMFVSETAHALYVLQRRASGDIDYRMPASSRKIDALEYLAALGIEPAALANENVQTRLVLFTRSEGQYLFPESMKNPDKHVLDGRALLKWWLKNVDRIADDWTGPAKYLNILNSESRDIMRYFPSSSWKIGNVYDSHGNTNEPAIYAIPLLPDDPKGRFLEHLVVEGRAKKVEGKQFWQELAIRQEFSFGAVVGLIGISGLPSYNLPNCDQNEYNLLSPTSLNHFKELVTTKDYSDRSDWGTLLEELLLTPKLKQYDIHGRWEGRQSAKRKAETVKPVINTLMCVRSKKKQKS